MKRILLVITLLWMQTLGANTNTTNICTQEYNPVCGAVDYDIVDDKRINTTLEAKTFNNMCLLEQAESILLHNGKCESSYEANLIIKSETIKCLNSSVGLTDCMQIQEEGTQEWESTTFIEDFTYQKHYIYKLRVLVRKNPLVEAGIIVGFPLKTYKLLKILDKKLDENGNFDICNFCSSVDTSLPENDICTRIDCLYVCPSTYEPVCGISKFKYQKSFMNRKALQNNNAYHFLHYGHCDARKGEKICTADCPGAKGINDQCEIVSACNACGLGSAIIVTKENP